MYLRFGQILSLSQFSLSQLVHMYHIKGKCDLFQEYVNFCQETWTRKHGSCQFSITTIQFTALSTRQTWYRNCYFRKITPIRSYCSISQSYVLSLETKNANWLMKSLLQRTLLNNPLRRKSELFGHILRRNSSASVVSGYRARLEIQGSRVQTRLRSMGFFRT